ncbi:hypothetical protein RJ639_038118 [Escallonia herrerae]|uniref:Retrovirus-related Pol polyprotein from transposon TNT 1-94 n=1 Tax=Escallonia herrerae TaxID=1293975 RepID=A0AA88WP48_9ASTE|nr:hypothetical protein RJ639_038118 [Escallonia herrerae]
MKEGTSINDHLDEYNKVILDQQNIDIKIKDKDQALLLLCSLPRSYEYLVTTLLYGKDNIFMEKEDRDLSHKEGHYRKDCPERKGKENDNSKIADVVGVIEDNSDGVDVLLVTISSSNGRCILNMGMKALDVILDESSILSKKEELIDAGKDHGARGKVELEVRALDSLPRLFKENGKTLRITV